MVFIVRYFFLAFFILLWSAGLTTYISRWLVELDLITDKVRFGDLYQFSALPQFKQTWPVYSTANRSSDTSSTHLYIIGDSFTLPLFLNQSDFQVSGYQRWDRWTGSQFTKIRLDSSKRNILLIESIERTMRQSFSLPLVPSAASKIRIRKKNFLEKINDRYGYTFHRVRVESRLESVLFNYNWVFWFKELKAVLTLGLFNRTDERVKLSTDRKNIFYHMDIDKQFTQNSSFSELSDDEVDTLVTNINLTADHYRQLGFDEVFLSIIPNKASILETDRNDYNHLIERIQNNSHLKVQTINTYEAFKQSPKSPYLKGDTHWNLEGRAIWLNLVRSKLKV
ncbi:hypothetical protein [Spirosoma harenae]